MTSLTEQFHPDNIIDTVLELVAEDHLVSIIDDPIQNAAGQFNYRSQESDDYYRFIDTTSRFFSHINNCVGTFYGWLPHSSAQQDLMQLLEDWYRTPHGSGFHIAYLDAIEDMDLVLSRIAGIIISRKRQRYARWVYHRWIAGLNWNKRCALSRNLSKRTSLFSENLQRCSPTQLADHIFDLISSIVSSNNTITGLLIGDKTLAN